jgi:hypothetical protein
MKTISKITFGLLVIALLLSLSFVPVMASDKPAGHICPTFYAAITHGINGERLGLSRDLPVVAEVYYGPNLKLLAKVDLVFKQQLMVELPRGQYLIKVFSPELDSYIDSMQVGPVEIPGCVKVGLHARLVDGTPTILVRITELIMK